MKTARILAGTGLVLIFISTAGFAADKKAVPQPAPATKEAAAKPEANTELLDINTATKEQLKALVGISDLHAKDIINGRPYAKKDQLISRKILPESTYNKIKDKIIAKQPKK